MYPDGTFERQHYSPGNNSLIGSWEVRWNALPLTLVLTCERSDDPDRVGKIEEVKLIQVDDKVLVYQGVDQPPITYQRVKEQVAD